VKENSSIIKEKLPNKTSSQINSIMGDLWHKLGSEEKKIYQDQYLEKKNEYQQNLEKFY
jgi:hemerythrin superfamily protein